MKPNQLSQTAAFIAIKFYGLTKDEPFRSLFDKETITFYDQLVKEFPPPLNRYHTMLNKKWLRSFFQWSEELLLPGDLMHILMRKYYITRMIEKLLDEGYQQIIVPGAGFDHLAARYTARQIPCLELDTPRMSELKKEFLHHHGYMNKHLKLVHGYFLQDRLYDVLKNESFISPHKKTIIIAEGFFDYLTEERTEEILSDIREYFKNDTTLISTAFALNELNPFHRFVFKLGVRMVGETLLLDHSFADFKELLKNHNFEINERIAAKSMKQETLRKYGIMLPILDGFYLLQATGNYQVKK